METNTEFETKLIGSENFLEISQLNNGINEHLKKYANKSHGNNKQVISTPSNNH